RQQHLAKTRYQNLPTETGPENRAFLLSFATRRQRDLANTPYSRKFRVQFESYAKSTACWLRRQSCTNRSPRKFPARGLFTGNFWRVRLIFEEPAVLLRADSKAYQRIPDFVAQGIFLVEQGIFRK